jgi:DNA-binding transcriptional ArsR family regulator
MRASTAAPVFAALGDETRLHLVTRLGREGPLSIAKLTERTSITRQAVAKHLRVLEGAGVVASSRDGRDGRESVWKLEAKRLEDARAHLEVISRQWDDTLERLRAFVEDE